MPVRAIFETDSASYVCSAADVEMMARALWGEKHASTTNPKEAGAILWCWMSRFMLWPVTGPAKWKTLNNLIVHHSQPVNPAWAATGKFCLGSSHESCSADKLTWRAKVQQAGAAEIPGPMWEYARQFAAGQIVNSFPQFVNFSAKNEGVKVAGGESFLTKGQDGMVGWLPGSVRIAGYKEVPILSDSNVVLGLVLTGLAVALLLWVTK